MSRFSQIDPKTKRQLITIIIATIVIGGYIIYDIFMHGPLHTLFTNREEIASLVKSTGIFAPLCFVFLQVLQTVIAPIPGQVTGLIGGFIFGWWGILWSILGGMTGYCIIFLISKKFGRPLVEKIIGKDSLTKFSFFLDSKYSAIIILLIFLVPGLPDDIVGYIAGLSHLSVKKLMALLFLGHLPTTIITNYIGMGLGSNNLAPIIIISLILTILFAFAIYNRERLINAFRNIAKTR